MKGHGHAFFLIVLRMLGQDDYVARVAETLEELQRNGVGNTTVQQLLPVDTDYTRYQRHAGRGPDPVETVVSVSIVPVVDGGTGFHISADDVEIHGIGFKGGKIKGIVLERNFVVAEIGAVQIPFAPHIAPAAVPLVVAEAFVVSYGATNLARCIIAAECRTC